MFANNDVRELVECFIKHQVKFVLIGGYAVVYYTEPRFTKDIDFLVEATSKNSKNIRNALEEFGVPMEQVSTDTFEKEGNFFKVGKPPWRVDLITSVKGISFSSVYSNSIDIDIGGISIKIVSLEDLMLIKKEAGRPQDLLDLAKLNEISVEE